MCYEIPLFSEKKRVTDESKRKYVAVKDDTETPAEKQNKVYEKLKDHIQDSVGFLYWKEEKKMGSTQHMENEDTNIEIPK